jgi:hypothetical protein
MPDQLTVEGVEFKKPHGEWHYGAVLFSQDLVLKLDYPHPNKVNRVPDEVRILTDLNIRGAVCAPRLKSGGILSDGRAYMIMELITRREGLEPIHVLRAHAELQSFGYLHGDMKAENVIFDGSVAVLIDFDQTVRAPEIASMTIDEACAWAEARKTELPWRQCNPLRQQLEQFDFRNLYNDRRLNLSQYTLLRFEGK